jgi:hypothetical protein
MSYSGAREALDDNARRLFPGESDEFRWKINMALMALVDAVEEDLAGLRAQLNDIDARLKARGI